MKIDSVSYETAEIETMYDFYANDLEFPVVEHSERRFTVAIGSTDVTFERTSQTEQFYHYAIRIPKGQLRSAKEWVEERTNVISNEAGGTFVEFSRTDSYSMYFFDPADNLVEFVVRNRIDDREDGAFSPEFVREVNEVGLPVTDVEQAVRDLTRNLPIEPVVSSDESVVPVGNLDGMVIVHPADEEWFMTENPARVRPIELTIESSRDHEYRLDGHPYTLIETSDTRR